ncbi:MAG: mannuronate-specific alginate lyase [Pseudomonas sp.]|uniref:mannuronate-specific alginate lyase n=1 Tax=Pseudomonas sp. TaxID=306 RepID=UPI00339259B9
MRLKTAMKPLCYPTLLGLALYSAVSQASALVPPPGYYAAVPMQQKSKVEKCPTVPAPFTGALIFHSKYEGSDKARATLNTAAEQSFRDQTRDITDMEKGLTKLVMHYLRDGQPQQLECALQWLDSWAQADALRSEDFNHTGKSMRKWALGSLAGAYLRLKFSASQPLQPYGHQTRAIEAWFVRLADQVVGDWSELPLKNINNHSYWAAWSVMTVAVVSDRRDLFDWSVKQLEVAAQQVDEQGFLPNELKREQRALAYHNYSLPPLLMIAAFAQSNGVDLRETNHRALQRLAQRVIEGVDDADAFVARTDEDQDMAGLEKSGKLAWLEPYCALYACTADVLEWRDSLQPFKTSRLGGDVTPLFQQALPGAPAAIAERPVEKKRFWFW